MKKAWGGRKEAEKPHGQRLEVDSSHSIVMTTHKWPSLSSDVTSWFHCPAQPGLRRAVATLVFPYWAAVGSCCSCGASAPCRRITYLRAAWTDASKEPGTVVSATQDWLLVFVTPVSSHTLNRTLSLPEGPFSTHAMMAVWGPFHLQGGLRPSSGSLMVSPPHSFGF